MTIHSLRSDFWVMALAAVDHPNILRFIGVGYSAATAALPRLPKWIVTEIMPHSLHSYLRKQRPRHPRHVRGWSALIRPENPRSLGRTHTSCTTRPGIG